MSYGKAELNTLLTDSSITSLLTNSTGVFYDTVACNTYPDASTVGAEDTYINYYRVGPIDGGLPYLDTVYSVNCRAALMVNAETLSTAVFDAVNRVFNNSVFFKCDLLGVINPADPTDLYNSPLEIRAKSRDF